MNLLLEIICAVLIAIALYAVVAYIIYNRVQPQSRACVDCTTPAQANGYDLYYRELGADKGLPPSSSSTADLDTQV